MRRYHEEYDDWFRGTGGKPYRIALNSVDARAALQHRRYSRSPTEREPMQTQIQPQGIVGQLVNANPWGAFAGGCWLVADIVSGNTLIMTTVDAAEAIRYGRGQYSRVML